VKFVEKRKNPRVVRIVECNKDTAYYDLSP
jgi:hypothetical protein